MLPASKCQSPYAIWRARRCVMECGFHERKEKSCVGGRDTFARTSTCMRACVYACESKTTHACTCELTIERTRFSVSHRRLFPHVVLRHGSLFCSPSRPTLPRSNPYHCSLHILFASPFLPLVIPFRLPRTSNRCVTMVCHVRQYGFALAHSRLEAILRNYEAHIDNMISKIKWLITVKRKYMDS